MLMYLTEQQAFPSRWKKKKKQIKNEMEKLLKLNVATEVPPPLPVQDRLAAFFAF